jgi:polyisoprenoid-binding protein YceI
MNTSTSHAIETSDAIGTQWALDPGHSAVGFSVRHLTITNVRGEFAKFRGNVAYDPDRPEATRIEATIEVASLDTREPKRDTDLRSSLFFDAETYPEMSFVSKSARVTGDRDLEVLGDLTIRGATREVALAVRDISAPVVDMRGNRRVGATAVTKVRRADFGMTWNKTLDAGGVVVGEVVTVSLEISLIAAR